MHIVEYYDRFVAVINDKEQRSRLQLEYKERKNHDLYAELKTNSDSLIHELAEAVYRERERGTWSQDVFDYLVF